ASNSGFAVALDADGALCLWTGDGERMSRASTGVGLRTFSWYRIRVRIDCEGRTLRLCQHPLEPCPDDPTAADASLPLEVVPASPAVPLLIGAWFDSSKPTWFDVAGHYN